MCACVLLSVGVWLLKMGLVFLITRDFSEVGKVGAGTYMTREIGGGANRVF